MRHLSVMGYARRAAAIAGLAAVVATSACTPLAPVLHTGSGGSAPATSSPWAVHVATPHLVKAPAITAYPWWADEPGGNDPYGLTKRQCVSYAAWYLNSHGTPFGYHTQGPHGVATFRNATTWDASARSAGFTVSTKPLVGSVAQWHSNEVTSTVLGGWTIRAGSAGHVAIVTRVYSNGNVDIAQYNLT